MIALHHIIQLLMFCTMSHAFGSCNKIVEVYCAKHAGRLNIYYGNTWMIISNSVLQELPKVPAATPFEEGLQSSLQAGNICLLAHLQPGGLPEHGPRQGSKCATETWSCKVEQTCLNDSMPGACTSGWMLKGANQILDDHCKNELVDDVINRGLISQDEVFLGELK